MFWSWDVAWWVDSAFLPSLTCLPKLTFASLNRVTMHTLKWRSLSRMGHMRIIWSQNMLPVIWQQTNLSPNPMSLLIYWQGLDWWLFFYVTAPPNQSLSSLWIRIGPKQMMNLLTETAIFYPTGNSCYFQLTGKLVFDLPFLAEGQLPQKANTLVDVVLAKKDLMYTRVRRSPTGVNQIGFLTDCK
jgi:hypothetical protein